MSKYGVFSGPYFPVFGLNSVRIQENTDQKNLRIWTLFIQWELSKCYDYPLSFQGFLIYLAKYFWSNSNSPDLILQLLKGVCSINDVILWSRESVSSVKWKCNTLKHASLLFYSSYDALTYIFSRFRSPLTNRWRHPSKMKYISCVQKEMQHLKRLSIIAAWSRRRIWLWKDYSKNLLKANRLYRSVYFENAIINTYFS